MTLENLTIDYSNCGTVITIIIASFDTFFIGKHISADSLGSAVLFNKVLRF